MVRSLDQTSFGVSAVRSGCRVTLLLSAAGLVYVLARSDQEHREIMVAILVLAMADGLTMWRLVPHERLAASGWLIPVLLAWNGLHVVAITAVSTLDGGLDSPFVTMFFVSAVFAALTLPRRLLLLVASWDAVGLVVTGVVGGEAGQLALYIPCALVIGQLSATIAGELHRRIDAVQNAQTETIEKLARAVEFRDAGTGGHIDRMAAYALVVARRLGFSVHECDLLHRASPLHDVGKIGVPDAILLKPGALTPEERSVMERHAEAGYQLLRGSHSELLQLGAEIALAHHERWDGAGYPHGLRGEQIPLAARIVAVADVFDALTHARSYKRSWPLSEVLDELKRQKGRQFDPAVVEALMRLVERGELTLDRPQFEI